MLCYGMLYYIISYYITFFILHCIMLYYIILNCTSMSTGPLLLKQGHHELHRLADGAQQHGVPHRPAAAGLAGDAGLLGGASRGRRGRESVAAGWGGGGEGWGEVVKNHLD